MNCIIFPKESLKLGDIYPIQLPIDLVLTKVVEVISQCHRIYRVTELNDKEKA